MMEINYDTESPEYTREIHEEQETVTECFPPVIQVRKLIMNNCKVKVFITQYGSGEEEQE